jgi:hypothetical protein
MLSRIAAAATALIAMAALAGCASAPRLNAVNEADPFVPEKFFIGTTYAQGEFVNIIDGTTRGVKAVIRGRFDGASLTLVEDFTYSDGGKERKTWTLTKSGNGVYLGTREDVIGIAKGRLEGPVFRLTYMANVKTRTTSYDLTFDDVLGYQPDGTVLNRAVVSKLGVKIGEITLRISRRPEAASLQQRGPRQ